MPPSPSSSSSPSKNQWEKIYTQVRVNKRKKKSPLKFQGKYGIFQKVHRTGHQKAPAPVLTPRVLTLPAPVFIQFPSIHSTSLLCAPGLGMSPILRERGRRLILVSVSPVSDSGMFPGKEEARIRKSFHLCNQNIIIPQSAWLRG